VSGPAPGGQGYREVWGGGGPMLLEERIRSPGHTIETMLSASAENS